MADSTLYKTLPCARSIRLLHLHPGADNERISCLLEVVPDLSSSPRYHALSYCWGDATDLTELECNSRTIMVTKNLYDALDRLRQETDTVWADAICINQADIAERNQQVSIMHEVYRRAFGVFIWTGPGDEKTEVAVSMIRKIVHRMRTSCDPAIPLWSWLSTLPAQDDLWETVTKAFPLQAKEYPDETWNAFWRFYRAPWFFRVWVIQEVRRAQNIRLFCGASEIEWSVVAMTATWVWHASKGVPQTHWVRKHFESLNGCMHSSLMWGTAPTNSDAPFLALLDMTRSFQSTDPRDKVFALLHHHGGYVSINNRGHLAGAQSPFIRRQNVSLTSSKRQI
jgi:hypothetical protein